MNEKHEKKEIRDHIVHIAFTKSEKKHIKKYSKESNMTISEFVRQATFDKIRKIQNPELFTTPSLNSPALEKIANRTKKILELQKLQIENQNILEEMNTTLTLIKNFSMIPDPEAKNTVLNLFKAFPSLNPKEIVEKTNFDKDVVFSIISELQSENLIEMTSKGRFKIK